MISPVFSSARFASVVAAAFLLCASVQATVSLPAVLSDHMVLQAGQAVPIWGWAAAGEEVTVSFGGESKTTQPDADGKWVVKFDNLKVSPAGQTLTVKGTNTITVADVLVGEVWLCSGQSNMEMQLKGLHGAVDHADEEIAAANFPQIRQFIYDQVYDIYKLEVPPAEPLKDRPGKWSVCTPATAATFSAVSYFFARDLHQRLKTPVGILNSSAGGTPIEAWTSLEAQQKIPALQPVLQSWNSSLTGYDPAAEKIAADALKKAWLAKRTEATKAGQPAPPAPKKSIFKNLRVSTPGGLFNGMIQPLIPYAVRGVLWWQGERNATGPLTGLYGQQLETLIADWRSRWGSELYFAWMQLPAAQKPQVQPAEPNGWGVLVRDGMRRTLKVPNTDMAISLDLGDPKQGHQTNKADFARRFSALAFHDVYAQPMDEWTGPLYRSLRREGNKLILTFDHAKGLKAAKGELTGFAIAGKDQKFVWAQAKIERDEVIVWSDTVAAPVAVRYAFASNPKWSLINGAGYPASLFRTDDWPVGKAAVAPTATSDATP